MILEGDGVTPEFSRPVPLDSLSVAERIHEIEATGEECAALARRFGILSVETLTASLRLKVLSGGDLVRVRGYLHARVTQACVVTLEPVPEIIDEAFELLYGPDPGQDSDEIVLDLESSDPPEPIVGNTIDIGEAVAEHLALALTPFPRKEDAEFAESQWPKAGPETGPEEKPNPFAALAGLKKK